MDGAGSPEGERNPPGDGASSTDTREATDADEERRRIPHYYLNNFRLMVAEVVEGSGYLLRQDERHTVEEFSALPEQAQRLFIRLYNRRGPWFRLRTLKYSTEEVGVLSATVAQLLAAGLCDVFDPLQEVQTGCALGSTWDAPLLTELLPLLLSAELRDLCRICRPAGAGGKAQHTRQDYVAALANCIRTRCEDRNAATASPGRSPGSGGSKADPISVSEMCDDSPAESLPNLAGSPRPPPSPRPSPAKANARRPSPAPSPSPSSVRRQSSIASFLTPRRSPARTDGDSPPSSNPRTKKTPIEVSLCEVLGPCIRVSPKAADLFSLLHRLFYMDWDTAWEAWNPTPTCPSLLLHNFGILKFAVQERWRERLFRSREEADAFRGALRLRERIWAMLGLPPDPGMWGRRSKDPAAHAAVLDLVRQQVAPALAAHRLWSLSPPPEAKARKEDKQTLSASSCPPSESAAPPPASDSPGPGRPAFLYRFTEEKIYLDILADAVEVLEGMRQYDEAVLMLRLLLDYPLYRPRKRGLMWNRMALDLEHLGRREEALEVCVSALAEEAPGVALRRSDRLRLERRRARLHNSLRRWSTRPPELPLREPPLEVIEGSRCPSATPAKFGVRPQWRSPVDAAETCGVEQLVLLHHSLAGWQGCHCEGGVVRALFSLLLWDSMFDETVPHAFHTRFQSAPLDLGTPAFFSARHDRIVKRIEAIAAMDNSALAGEVAECWALRQGFACAGLTGRTDGESLCKVVQCVPPRLLASLLYVVAQQFILSGFPDLTLWHEGQGRLRFVEVKGPGDHLSEEQEVWIDTLLGLGFDAAVCHVREA